VRAQGFALAHQPLGPPGQEDSDYTVVALARARTCAGRVVAPPEVAPAQLRVLARGLPGVHTVPTADGHFVLDHIPLGLEPRLLVDGLPATWTHLPARAGRQGAVVIEIVAGAAVRGRVLDATTRAPLADALVWCGEQDAVRTDADGRYELQRQLPGAVAIEAKWELVEGRRRTSFPGSAPVDLVAGREHDGVDVLVDTRRAR
jgi:hypothetical protein